jgi:hypothetical protein
MCMYLIFLYSFYITHEEKFVCVWYLSNVKHSITILKYLNPTPFKKSVSPSLLFLSLAMSFALGNKL